jgi:Lectin C-type domain
MPRSASDQIYAARVRGTAGLVLVLVGCGRIAFDPISTTTGDAGDDASGVGDSTSQACPSGCVEGTVVASSVCYCPTPTDSYIGQTICMSVGRTLIRIDSAVENTATRDFAEANGLSPTEPLIIGGTDEANEDDWRWIDGTPFWAGDFTGAPVGGAFAAWEVGQPNNNSGDEDCLEIDGTTRAWNDTECGRDLPFVCE